MAAISSTHSLTARPLDRWFVTADVAWLLTAAAGTVIGVIMRWPAQFGGAGSPTHIEGELLSAGTVLSPPLWMIGLVLVAGPVVVFATRTWSLAGAAVTGLVGVTGIVGALGEMVAAPTPDVPRAAQLCGAIGVALSLALVAASVHALRRTLHPR